MWQNVMVEQWADQAIMLWQIYVYLLNDSMDKSPNIASFDHLLAHAEHFVKKSFIIKFELGTCWVFSEKGTLTCWPNVCSCVVVFQGSDPSWCRVAISRSCHATWYVWGWLALCTGTGKHIISLHNLLFLCHIRSLHQITIAKT